MVLRMLEQNTESLSQFHHPNLREDREAFMASMYCRPNSRLRVPPPQNSIDISLAY